MYNIIIHELNCYLVNKLYLYTCRDVTKKGPYVGKIKIEFCIACSRGHSADHFDTKLRI